MKRRFLLHTTRWYFLCSLVLGGTECITPKEELHKEHQITSVHDEGGNNVLLGQGASLGLFHDQQVGSKGRDGAADNHLRDLQHGNPHWFEPFGFGVDGHEKVVKIHDGVDAVVHDRVNETRGRIVKVSEKGKAQDRHVVIPVQEDEGLLVDNDKDGIKEFPVFIYV